MLKNNFNKILGVAVVTLFCFQGISQLKQRVADRMYDELAYYKAVELYEDLAKKSKPDIHAVRRTAECYRLIDDNKNAEIWYSKLVQNPGVQPEDYYYYGQMLKSNEKYKEANVQMEKFYEASQGKDSRAVAHHDNKDYVDELKVHADRYEIFMLTNGVNTEDSDFGTGYYEANGEKMLTFTSARRNMNALNKKFQWDGSHFLDLYTAKLNEDGSVSKVDQFNKEVKSKYHEGPVAFAKYNGKEEMYLTRSNYLNKKKGLSQNKRHNNLMLYVATRTEGGEWSDLQEFKYNSKDDSYSAGHATISPDGESLYFVSDMPKYAEGNANTNRGSSDIWRCGRKKDGSWDLPKNVKSVNTEGKEMFPFISSEGILYFASDGHVGLGGLDLYRAEPKEEGEFEKPMNMGYPLNTNYDDFAFIVNDDETFGYVSSNRVTSTSKGDDDIYSVKILYPFGPKLFSLTGSTLDDETGDKLADVKLKLVNTETGEIIKEVMSDADGNYTITGIPEGKYKLVGEKERFQLVSPFTFRTDDADKREILDGDIRMKKNNCGLIGTITDAEKGSILEGVKVTMVNNATGEEREFITSVDGQFKDALDGIPCPGGLIDYSFRFEKEHYFPKEVDFKYRITKSGIVNLNEFMKVNLQSDTGTVNAFCEIGDILFDFNKYKIRPDAAAELDKLVKCMNENPGMRIEIGSHTDCRGKDKYNRRLSDKRAKSSMRYVISQGISKDRIFGRGYGEDRLIEKCAKCYDCSEEQHQTNRRTEFRIVSGGNGVKNNSSDSF